jgi:hypothetical protein
LPSITGDVKCPSCKHRHETANILTNGGKWIIIIICAKGNDFTLHQRSDHD